MTYSLYEVMNICIANQDFDEEKIDELEIRIRDDSGDPRAATIADILDSADDSVWSGSKSTDFTDLMELIGEYDSPAFNNFMEPIDATEFVDSPLTLQMTPGGGYEEMNDEGEVVGPVDGFGKPKEGHPRFRDPDGKSKELTPEDLFRTATKPPVPPAVKLVKREIPETTNINPWADQNNQISISLLSSKGKVIDRADVEGFLEKSPLGEQVEELVANNTELTERLVASAEYIETLTGELVAVKENRSQITKSAVDSDNKEIVRLETNIGQLLYTPQAVQVEEKIFLMYFHKDVTPAFIPNVDGNVYRVHWEGVQTPVQYLGGIYTDKINPDYLVMTFVVREDYENKEDS